MSPSLADGADTKVLAVPSAPPSTARASGAHAGREAAARRTCARRRRHHARDLFQSGPRTVGQVVIGAAGRRSGDHPRIREDRAVMRPLYAELPRAAQAPRLDAPGSCG